MDDILAARGFLYRLFQSLLSAEPAQQNVELLCSDTFAEAMDICEVPYDREKLDTLKEQFARNGEGFLNAGAGQYTRLFYGPNKLAAPPWESSYVEPDRKLFQKATVDVRRAYAEQGLRVHMVNRIPDDHLAIELGFLAEMAQRMADGTDIRAAAAASHDFLRNHPAKWVSRYARDMNASEQGGLYPFIAECIAHFANKDLEFTQRLSTDENN